MLSGGKSLINSNNNNIYKYESSIYHAPALYICVCVCIYIYIYICMYVTYHMFRKPYKVDTITVSILQIRKLRHRIVKDTC